MNLRLFRATVCTHLETVPTNNHFLNLHKESSTYACSYLHLLLAPEQGMQYSPDMCSCIEGHHFVSVNGRKFFNAKVLQHICWRKSADSRWAFQTSHLNGNRDKDLFNSTFSFVSRTDRMQSPRFHEDATITSTSTWTRGMTSGTNQFISKNEQVFIL